MFWLRCVFCDRRACKIFNGYSACWSCCVIVKTVSLLPLESWLHRASEKVGGSR